MKNRINIPLTIEGQLERYYTVEGHTDRHEVLWHAWNQNKRWISQLLQMTMSSFPTYSKHDETHAESVLHNIEMILGQERIAELSASDCFMLLHTVYIHDIGMCITYQDRENIIQNEKFIQMIENLQQKGDTSFDKAIRALKQTDYSYTDEEDRIAKRKRLYQDKLQVYYAIIHLLANYRRGEHGDISKERLYSWTLESDKLGIGFSLAGIPLRMFLSIASSAELHTEPDFTKVLELPQEDGGFASDYIHPRFVSVMLQLGDILDMDNNRFHPLTKECMGELPETSEQHFDKHLAIRRLHITPDKISIMADCKTQESLRLVRKECNMLTDILKSAGYYWSVICPPDFKGTLPTVASVELFLEGKKIPEELVTTKFEISQEKAFDLLEGSNVYSGRFVFLREFLQNAIDASKMQYWKECISTAGYYKSEKDLSSFNPNQLEEIVSTKNFPIEIEMELQKKDREGNLFPIDERDIENMDCHHIQPYNYGVKVRIKDFGTGIGKNTILKIAKVGTSRKEEYVSIKQMPDWLRPTAEFGIGMQSAFLVTDTYKCRTHTRNGERYEITFGSAALAKYEGYINVQPIDRFEGKEDTYGTCFEIFVPYDKKFLHKDCMEAWNGEDGFEEDYHNRRPLRHSAELLSQMAIYLDNQVGELLFPVHLNVKKNEYIDIPLMKNEKNSINHLFLRFSADNVPKIKKNEIVQEFERIEWIKDFGRIKDTKLTLEIVEERIKKCVEEEWYSYIKGVGTQEKGDSGEIGENREGLGNRKELREEDKVVESERSWRNSRRAWIYYQKEIKDDQDIIFEEVENNVFLFDCRSSRLYIWDGKNHIFALFGVQNLLNEEQGITSGANKKESNKGTRIFYKGMELENGREDTDCELFEYIDIKREMGRKYINLSRRGFTEQGEQYFKSDIYPVLIDVVKTILKYIAQNHGEKLRHRIKQNIKYKCLKLQFLEKEIKKLREVKIKDSNWKNKQEIADKLDVIYQKNMMNLRQNIIAIIMFSYYANKDENNELMHLGCTNSQNENCPWMNLLDEVNSIIGENEGNVKGLLGEDSALFDIKVYNEFFYLESESNRNRKMKKYSIIDIFSNKKKYAVISNRKSNFGGWTHTIIEIENRKSEEQDIVKCCNELIEEKNTEKRKKLSICIERWGECILNNFRNKENQELYSDEDYKQQRVIRWLLHSVPTIAMLSSADGKTRINVLGGQIPPFIYLNNHFKILILKRIKEKYEKNKILRFSTLVWQGREYLACSEIPFSMYFVKRGYLSLQSLNKVIFPFDGKDFSEILKYVEGSYRTEFESKLCLLLDGLNFNRSLNKNDLTEKFVIKDMVRTFYDRISTACDKEQIEEVRQTWQERMDKISSRDLEEMLKRWKNFYVEFFKCGLALRSPLQLSKKGINEESNTNITPNAKNEFDRFEKFEKLFDSEEFKEIVSAWIYITVYLSVDTKMQPKITLIRNTYNELLEQNVQGRMDKRKRMIQYVRKEGKYPLDSERIENCLKQFEEEIWNLLGMIEMDKYKEYEKILGAEGERLKCYLVEKLELQ